MGDREDVFKRFARDNPLAAGRLVDVLGDRFARQWDIVDARALFTLIPRLDHALNGLPPGVIEIFGAESSGKTALIGTLLAAAQEQGKTAALCATEDLDIAYWEALGVDTSELLLIEAEDIEDLAYMACDFVRGPDRVLAIDSITAMRPQMDDTPVREFCYWRDLVYDMVQEATNTSHSTSTMIVTSQVRARKSVDPRRMFAGGTDTASKAIADTFVTRLELTREGITEDSYILVVNILSNVFKNPTRIVSLPALKGFGIDQELDLVRFSAEKGVIEKRGNWYTTFGEILQGEQKAALYLKTNRDAYMKLRNVFYRTP